MTAMHHIDDEVTMTVTDSYVTLVKQDVFGLTTGVSLTPAQMKTILNVFDGYRRPGGAIDED